MGRVGSSFGNTAAWDVAAAEDSEARARGIGVAVERLAQLTAVVHVHGRPWRIAGDADTGLKDYPTGWYSDWHHMNEGLSR